MLPAIVAAGAAYMIIKELTKDKEENNVKRKNQGNTTKTGKPRKSKKVASVNSDKPEEIRASGGTGKPKEQEQAGSSGELNGIEGENNLDELENGKTINESKDNE